MDRMIPTNKEMEEWSMCPIPESEEICELLEEAGCVQEIIDQACKIVEDTAEKYLDQPNLTPEPPSEPGWYWFKSSKNNKGWQVYKLYRNAHNKLLYAQTVGGHWILIKNMDGLWGSAISEPASPDMEK